MEHLATQLKDHLLAHGFSTVREVIVQKRPDWTGEESLFVWVLLDDSVPDDDLDWDDIEPLNRVASDWMRASQPDFFPYLRFRRQREWAEVANS